MANLSKQKNQDKWVDDLLIKDTSGRIHPFKNKDTSKKSGLLSSLKPIEPIVQQMEANINTSPADDNFVAPTTLTGKSDNKADFSFHPDDKKQLDEVAKTMTTDTSHKYSIEKIIDRLIAKQGLNFDKANKDFFSNVIFDFFRNRKKIIAVRDLLSNQVFAGKDKLSEDVIDSILSVVKGIKNKISTVGGLVVRMSDMPPQASPVKTKPEFKLPAMGPETSASSAESQSRGEEKPIKKPVESLSQKAPVKQPIVQAKISKPVVKPKFDLPSEFVIKPKPVADLEDKMQSQEKPKLDDEIKAIEVKVAKKDFTTLPKVMRPGAQVKKQQVTDVVKKQPDKNIASKKIITAEKTLSGPIEELQSMTLNNFRYLGDSAQERIEKILEKIQFLEKDGYTKKARGIEAWRKSKVYHMYLDLGDESMVQNKEVANLISEYEKQDKETLSIAEFSAVSDLNKQLRF